MTTYQFEIDDEKWREWKDTVPRSKSLDERIRELIEADANGRLDSDEQHDQRLSDDAVAALQDRAADDEDLDAVVHRLVEEDLKRMAGQVHEEIVTTMAQGNEQPSDDIVLESGGDLRDRAEDTLDELHVPGRDPAVERTRREAVMWAWEYLRRRGEATSSEIANATFGAFWDDENLGYSISSRYPGYGLWDNCVRDALAELPGVDAPVEKGNEWAFAGNST